MRRVDEVRYSTSAKNDLVKLLVLAWDPDFTKVTEEERSRMEIADEEMRKGIFFSEADVWGE